MTNSVIYIGPVEERIDQVTGGGQVWRYHVLQQLRRRADTVTALLPRSHRLRLAALRLLFRRRTTAWVEYPDDWFVTGLGVVASLIPWVRIILDVHDLPIHQYRALRGREPSQLTKLLMRATGGILLARCERATLAAPGLRALLPTHARGKAVDMPTGCTLLDNAVDSPRLLPPSGRRRILYAGAITTGRLFEPVLEAIERLSGWELVVVGAGEGALVQRIRQSPGVVYLGPRPYLDVVRLLHEIDAVVVPYPRGPYFDISLPVKVPDSLASGKPIIMPRLPFIDGYVRRLGLQRFMLFVDELSADRIIEALGRIPTLTLDPIEARAIMSEHTWEKNLDGAMSQVLPASSR